jgi:hypothetical protein
MTDDVIQTPGEHLGYLVGTDRKLADWPEIVDYFMKVGESSPRVIVSNLGETTEGNPFILATISSPSNLENLEELRGIQLRLGNPEGLSENEASTLIARGKTVALITCSIHSTEVGGSQMSMELLYKLATDDSPEVKTILDNVVFLFVPSLNPDGNRIVVDWYNKYLGTDYEGTSPPYVYHKYAGHDNNRDWYMFTLKETQLTVKHVHNMWHPQIVYDIHQMGRTGPRLFVPPFTDPYEPNIDPVIISGVSLMGTSMADALTREGNRGVATHWVFDAWTPARAYQHYHGGIRILSEAASVKIATPLEISVDDLKADRGFNPLETRWNHPMPWRGGMWTLRDIIDYELSACLACLQTAANFRERWLRGTFEMGKRALTPVKGPYAFLVPPNQRDEGAVVELISVLQMGDVAVHMAEEPFMADGLDYPAGTYVILYAQPYGCFAKTLLEKQVYPDLRDSPEEPPVVPYDVTAHTLSLQLGVNVSTVDSAFEAKLKKVDGPVLPQGMIYGRGSPYYLLSSEPNYAFKAVNRLLKEGCQVSRSFDVVEVENRSFRPGAFIVKSRQGLEESLESMTNELGLSFHGVDRPLAESFELNQPKIGVYRGWLPNADEGWLRMVLEEYGFKYVNLSPQDVRKGNLKNDVDVLIIPDLKSDNIFNGMSMSNDSANYEPMYREGVGERGTGEILNFLDDGGSVITINRACEYAVDKLFAGAELPLKGLDEKKFYCPGSLLRVMVDNTHPVGYGFRREETVMFLNSPAFKVKEGCAIAWYPETDPLVSGWVLGEKSLRGNAAVAEIPAGNGMMIMIGCTPYFRNQNRATFKLLFNSLLYCST